MNPRPGDLLIFDNMTCLIISCKHATAPIFYVDADVGRITMIYTFLDDRGNVFTQTAYTDDEMFNDYEIVR